MQIECDYSSLTRSYIYLPYYAQEAISKSNLIAGISHLTIIPCLKKGLQVIKIVEPNDKMRQLSTERGANLPTVELISRKV
ncbi:hypothetical protein [Rickettsiales endosymbiont of Stachyamoeba lipophora]|uniref:hypothetical protein n=1 Tax=Rickettsiales endosymbiont of Stachyamoeba lipophora TaxID=2486578 RepID=UPI000F64FF50|nr:hypothetical protein [Rickettsiales endosymbiont of Stachyamoeba lipophora]AZL16266.1 hypothetical protein EF513_06970 [Rickettsiales endosymbiont of Stachyamoeba lipophora]